MSDDTPSTAPESPSTPSLPDDVLIIVPMRNVVLFPELVMPITVGRPKTIAGAQEAVKSGRSLGLLLQKDPDASDPGPDELYRVGTMASVLRYVAGEDGHRLVCQGQSRFRVLDFIDGYPFLLARVEHIHVRDHPNDPEIEAHMLTLRDKALEALGLLPQIPQELGHALRAIDHPGLLVDTIAGYLDLPIGEKQEVLELLDLRARMERVQHLLDYRVEVLRLSQKISQRTHETMSERQREVVLREQLRAIQQELGEGDEKAEEIRELESRIDACHMPDEVATQARKELARLARMPEGAGEYAMARTYLDWLLELPWASLSEEHIDIARARDILDTDHFGLERIKKRILEHLAVHKLNPEGKSPILCFVGPPGVGKTSLGQSIARAMGREFVRASLGGVHDEAEIRGHRRTYIGALPGNIIQALRKAGTRNPVFMLDEMDKLGAGIQGDPSSALLEVLDPEQNSTFRDNYLGVPFDLSRVMFIGTANVLDQIPGPLRDRMEVIELPGYTEQEKVEIARRYLVQRQRQAVGLDADQWHITDAALHRIISDYTREAGVRNLERLIGAVARHVAVRIAEGTLESSVTDVDDLREPLGAARYENEVAMRTSVPGVATGLAWTPVGGDILFIEASQSQGSGRLILTGQLGEVMKESAQAALSLIKANAAALGVDAERVNEADIHVHVPAGAIPKDGPSAGVALYTALVSLLTLRCVRADLAMTGEITLRGLVLPVGGIKEKVLAAQRAGIRTVLLPARNRRDWEDIPEMAREQLVFYWIERVEDAIRLALQDTTDALPT
ncbi:endopeptidase La [Halomonas sp. TRM85114]|uniref:endopeptidase La n=1 Tax=Halomonas jincaotanensis TaxID=2810616 RepID=UPI001BD27AD5|nr:endopeptidase La [Halomonas jincaotanensis]MBS9402204.1 endopeptidase La [Halomonas jincaotanensis]